MYTAEHLLYAPARWLLTGEPRCLSCDARQRCGMGFLVKGWGHNVKRAERLGILVIAPPGSHIPLICLFKGKDVMMRGLAEVPVVGDCLGVVNMVKPRNIPTIPIRIWIRLCPVYKMMCLLAPAKFARPRWIRPVEYD